MADFDLQGCLRALAEHFPTSKWTVVGKKQVDAAILYIGPLALKLVVFHETVGPFPAGAASLTLHAEKALLRRFGTPSITAKGETTNYSMDMDQFMEAASEAASELIGIAASILAVTEGDEEAESLTGIERTLIR